MLVPCSDEEMAQKRLHPRSRGGMFARVAALMSVSPERGRQGPGRPAGAGLRPGDGLGQGCGGLRPSG